MKKILLLVAAMFVVSFAGAQGYVPPSNYSYTVTGNYYNSSVYANGANVDISIPAAVPPFRISSSGTIYGMGEPTPDNSFFSVPSYSSSTRFSLSIYPHKYPSTQIPKLVIDVTDSKGTVITIIINQNPY